MHSKLKTISLFGISLIIAAVLGGLAGLFGFWVPAALLLMLLIIFLTQNNRGLIYIAIGSVGLGQFGRIPPGSNGVFLLIDLLVAAIFLVWVLETMYVWRQGGKQMRLDSSGTVLWAGFLAISLVILIFSPLALAKRELLQAGFYWFRLLIYTSLIWVVPTYFPTEAEKKKLYRYLVRVGLVVVGFGFVQLLVFPNIGSLARFGWDPHEGRLVSSFLDPNYLGGYLALLLAALTAPAIQGKKSLPWIWLGIVLLASVLTFSRSGYLAVAITVLLLGLRYSWKLIVVTLLCIIPLSLAIPRVRERVVGGFSLDKTSQDRLDSWQNALKIGAAYPVFGVGFNAYQYAQERLGIINPGMKSRALAGSDSSLLNLLATTGIAGVTLVIAAAALLIRRSLILARQGLSNTQNWVGLIFLTALPALFIHSFFVNTFFYPFILINLSVLVGLISNKNSQDCLV